MASVSDTLTKITDRLQVSATTKTVYGDPIVTEDKTLIPWQRFATASEQVVGPIPATTEVRAPAEVEVWK